MNRMHDTIHWLKVRALKLREKTWSSGDTRLHYVYVPAPGSRRLLVMFSAYNDGFARYNYVGTLRSWKGNKLFILDDFGSDHLGSYYLGEKGRHNVEGMVLDLIRHWSNHIQCRQLILAGSSKGGYSALNFACHFPGCQVIAGAPQYYLGSYLLATKEHLPSYIDIMQDVTPEHTRQLDEQLQKKLAACSFARTIQIFLHYSTAEHTYAEHIQDLREELLLQGFRLTEEALTYPEHAQLIQYFPAFLWRSLQAIEAQEVPVQMTEDPLDESIGPQGGGVWMESERIRGGKT